MGFCVASEMTGTVDLEDPQTGRKTKPKAMLPSRSRSARNNLSKQSQQDHLHFGRDINSSFEPGRPEPTPAMKLKLKAVTRQGVGPPITHLWRKVKFESREELVGLPLDQLELEVLNKRGVTKHVPALHKGFAEVRMFMPFTCPPEDENEKAGLEQWCEKMKYLQEDLQWLLRLPHHRFWSQIVYHESLHLCLLSYLTVAPRSFDRFSYKNVLGEAEQQMLTTTHRLVFLVYLRMSTYKESKSCHITPSVFADLIYENYLFDIPKIMDLCALYGSDNRPLLQKMLQNIFANQPRYLVDLEDISPTLLNVFDAVLVKLGLQQDEDEKEDLKASCQSPDKRLEQICLSDVEDIIDYLVDVLQTLSSFLDVYPPACNLLHNHNAEIRIALFYSQAMEPLQEVVDRFGKQDLLHFLSVSRSCLLQLFREILTHCCIQPILEASSDSETNVLQNHVSELFRILELCLSEKQFICDYQSNFPVDDDLDMLKQTQCDIDEAHTNFILQSIHGSFDGPTENPSTDLNLESIAASHTLSSSSVPHLVQYPLSSTVPAELEGACAGPRVEGVELDSLISHIHSILPHYGEGFLETCLEYYNYNSEVVVDHLLQNDLPSVLESVDKSMPRKLHNEPKAATDLSLLSERKNIFDGDQFDVFSERTQTFDQTKIHKGKKDEDYKAILESRDHVQKSKTLYERYDLVSEEVGDLYEDEYDDTYDSVSGWAEEPITPDPFQERRAFTVPRVLRKKEFHENDYESEGEEEKSETAKVDPWTEQIKEDFHKRLERRGGPTDSRIGPASVKYKDRQGPPPRRGWENVQGKPKGQGQDDKTQHGRSQKEKHKSTYANHNRRAQADRKRNQGMIRT